MLDLTIDSLGLHWAGAAGHEHRIDPITRRAVALVAHRLNERQAVARAVKASHLGSLSVPPLRLDLSRMNDERIANTIADVLFEALVLKLGL